jgi:hypothetical protein
MNPTARLSATRPETDAASSRIDDGYASKINVTPALSAPDPALIMFFINSAK